ncbi:4a-hydroxytetrahydrobiopterin dehydratase [Pengzhenrongella sicca]|uniref:Putative pterin-4-alpha-carbinolamine dehydratase n=1 Tax=Pengzhenrongella sicca TaxID=2819238 RepID=A0A8A4ZA20_9MICO|nr:4a-hydroxytetrahydrobiopterin dehydratase [Pengzhenrongella sicca]QTE28694.1 4a-hydroxytetrahydrobiopterin dehydratase [Pengzhenrongella sicca]
MATRLTDGAAQGSVDERHWRVVQRRLHASFRTGDFARGVELVARIGDLAEAAGHHPDLDLRYPRVHVVLTTHDAGGLTGKDVALAREISAVADELGFAGDPTRPAVVEIAIDALQIPAVQPFWRAVLGYRDEVLPPSEGLSPAVVDPDGIGPTVWFQQMDAPRPQRNRIHVDVDVPHDVAQERVAAAIAAGGRLVSDRRAPAFWVLADPEGNEACVCTWQAREG